MVRRETDWLRTLGGTVSSREVESRVNAGMERLYARRREAVPKNLKFGPQTSDRRQKRRAELAQKSDGKMWVRAAKPTAPVRGPRCRNCGLCLGCKRVARLRRIQDLGRKGDLQCMTLSWDFYALVNATASGGAYRDRLGNVYLFGDMPKRDRSRAFETAFDRICDHSASLPGLGAWR